MKSLLPLPLAFLIYAGQATAGGVEFTQAEIDRGGVELTPADVDLAIAVAKLEQGCNWMTASNYALNHIDNYPRIKADIRRDVEKINAMFAYACILQGSASGEDMDVMKYDPDDPAWAKVNEQARETYRMAMVMPPMPHVP